MINIHNSFFNRVICHNLLFNKRSRVLKTIMTNISWIRPRTCCSSISLISGRRGSHNSIPIVRHINFDHFTTTVSYNVYLPWWNSNHSYMQHQQIAQFCKKTKLTKETALASTTSPTNTGTNTSTTIAADRKSVV